MNSEYDVLEYYNLDENVSNEVIEKLLKRDNDFVGKINYLGFKGEVVEISYYTKQQDFIEAINEDKWCGRLISISTLKGNKRKEIDDTKEYPEFNYDYFMNWAKISGERDEVEFAYKIRMDMLERYMLLNRTEGIQKVSFTANEIGRRMEIWDSAKEWLEWRVYEKYHDRYYKNNDEIEKLIIKQNEENKKLHLKIIEKNKVEPIMMLDEEIIEVVPVNWTNEVYMSKNNKNKDFIKIVKAFKCKEKDDWYVYNSFPYKAENEAGVIMKCMLQKGLIVSTFNDVANEKINNKSNAIENKKSMQRER